MEHVVHIAIGHVQLLKREDTFCTLYAFVTIYTMIIFCRILRSLARATCHGGVIRVEYLKACCGAHGYERVQSCTESLCSLVHHGSPQITIGETMLSV
jgi:hypothetical protein